MLNLNQGLAAYEDSEFERAYEILMPLAQAGEIEAQKVIAGMYVTGRGVERDIIKAIHWYRPVAEQGDPIAQHNLAMFLLSENLGEAIQWLLVSAKQDFPFAQKALGDIYSGEISFSSKIEESFINFNEAVNWYRKAATGGFLSACHRLGEIYAYAQGVEKDEKQASEWFRKAATKNYKPSQEALGKAYFEGLLGLPKDSAQAQYWFTQAEGNEQSLK
jgi:uncharacterized protein